MGFSVSGSAVVVFMGMFIALSTFYAAMGNVTEDLDNAGTEKREQLDEIHDTGLNITAVKVIDTANCDVAVTANNTGGITLSLMATDLLFDNEYQTGWEGTATIENERGTVSPTDQWHPGERVNITREGLNAPPERVKLVTEGGVADATEVSGLTC